MQTTISNDFDATLIDYFSRTPGPIRINELVTEFPQVDQDTLRRRVKGLARRDKLGLTVGSHDTGYSSIRRYDLDPDWMIWPELSVSSDDGLDSCLPLSAESDLLRKQMQQPLALRKPTGYNRDFLTSYVPNCSFYLPEDIRAHLHRIGRTPDPDRPAGTYARAILGRLMVDFAWASSRLEGNSYSLLETERLIQFGQEARGRRRAETQMIVNHKAAIEFLLEDDGTIGLNRHTVLNLHALLADNLLPHQSSCGRLRSIPVGIGCSTYMPLAVPQQIDEYFDRILNISRCIRDPFEQAFFLMVHLPYLQPFEDVNKRVSRLALNIPLFQHNLCPMSFVDVPERTYISGTLAVYELNRVELLREVFVWAYQRSCRRYVVIRETLGEPNPFRVRYRQQLMSAVRFMVQEQRRTTQVRDMDWSWLNVNALDREAFYQMLDTELAALHEGNFARFRLTPLEYQRWSGNGG